jgi:4-amino-4-deoxy-L-arabinose transferase-like glycosyltransferase
MGDAGAVAELLIGFFMPLVFAAILQSRWSAGVKQVVSFILYMLVAIVVWIIEHENAGLSTWRDYVITFANIIIGGTVGYFGLWRRTLANRIEKATNAAPGE